MAWSPFKLPPPKRLFAFGCLLVLLIMGGTIGYRLIEGWSWFDSFYKAGATLTSIGAEMATSKVGRAFTIALALGGISTVALAAGEVLRTVITGELRNYLEKRRMDKRIDDLERHVIVCGYGRVGRSTCAHLTTAGMPYVVIENKDEAIVAARAAGALPVAGDATSDAILRRAGIDRARALVTAAGNDAANVLITMSARLLNPELPIVARAIDETAVPKLLRAGATRTVSPYEIGGGRIAQAVLRPTAWDLIETGASERLDGVQLVEQRVRAGSALDHVTVRESGLRSRLGLVLLAVKHSDGEVVFNPGDDALLDAGDTCIVVGPRAQLDRAVELSLPR